MSSRGSLKAKLTLLTHKPLPKTTADHWVIRQLMNASDTISRSLEDYRFAEAIDVVYHTIWDDVADWYIEASKESARGC